MIFIFWLRSEFQNQVIPLHCQNETEPGSAGEQPVKDNF
jgi:hypothetical protein